MNFITPTSVGKPQHFPRCLTESLTSQMGASAVSLTEIISAPTVSALPPCHGLTSLIIYTWLKDWIFVCPFKFTFRASYSCSSWLSLKSFTLPSESWRLINNIPVSQCLILSAWCWGLSPQHLWDNDLKECESCISRLMFTEMICMYYMEIFIVWVWILHREIKKRILETLNYPQHTNKFSI